MVSCSSNVCSLSNLINVSCLCSPAAGVSWILPLAAQCEAQTLKSFSPTCLNRTDSQEEEAKHAYIPCTSWCIRTASFVSTASSPAHKCHQKWFLRFFYVEDLRFFSGGCRRKSRNPGRDVCIYMCTRSKMSFSLKSFRVCWNLSVEKIWEKCVLSAASAYINVMRVFTVTTEVAVLTRVMLRACTVPSTAHLNSRLTAVKSTQ